MTAEAAFTRSWPVGSYNATLSTPKPKPGQQLTAVIEWTPSQPRRLTPAEFEQYRSGRDAALAEMAAELRINVAVVDL